MFHSCFIEYVFVLNKFKYYSHFLVLSTSVNSRLTLGTKIYLSLLHIKLGFRFIFRCCKLITSYKLILTVDSLFATLYIYYSTFFSPCTDLIRKIFSNTCVKQYISKVECDKNKKLGDVLVLRCTVLRTCLVNDFLQTLTCY